MQQLFAINNKRKVTSFIGSLSDFVDDEKDLHEFVKKNLGILFGVQHFASEYKVNGLAIDTVALDKDHCPVLIEYKQGKDPAIASQITTYHEEFQKDKLSFCWTVKDELGLEINAKKNFENIRLICLASDFHRFAFTQAKKYKNLELVTYRFFSGKALLLEWQAGEPPNPQPKPLPIPSPPQPETENIQALYEGLSQEIAKLRHAEQHDARKLRRFKYGKTFACLRPRKKKVQIWVKLDPKKEKIVPGFTRDVSDIMTDAGSCDLEISVATQAQLRKALALCRKAYREQKPPSSKPAPRSSSRPTSNIKNVYSTLRYKISKCNSSTKALYDELLQGIANLGKDITPHEGSRLHTFKARQLFAALRPFPKKNKVTILVRLDPKQEDIIPGFTRDTTNITTQANDCPLEITVKDQKQLRKALKLCRKAYDQAKR